MLQIIEKVKEYFIAGLKWLRIMNAGIDRIQGKADKIVDTVQDEIKEAEDMIDRATRE